MNGSTTAFKGRALTQVLRAVKELNPRNVAAEVNRPIRLAVIGPAALLEDTAAFLLGNDPSGFDRAADALMLMELPLESGAFALLPSCDVVVYSQEFKDGIPGVPCQRMFAFDSTAGLPSVIKQIIQTRELGYAHLALAKMFPAFRDEVAATTIQNVSVENAIFVVSTSLGNIIPNPLQPLTAVAESLGDLVVLTANQLRMLFRLAGAYGKPLGIKEQMPEVLSVLGAAFGWRSLARELVGQLPLGGGVIPKAAIAFAGTWAVGDGIRYYYTTGHRLTRQELKERFDAAYEQGKKTAEPLAEKIQEGYKWVSKLRLKPGRGPE